MARQPSVFVREITNQEGQKLARISRRSNDAVRVRRAAVVLASAQGRPVSDICMLFQCSESYVRDVVHKFNAHGFGALDPKWSGGRPPTIDDAAIEQIARIALTAPTKLGRPFTVWSLAKLRDYLLEIEVVAEVSIERLRQLLHARDISWQAPRRSKPRTIRSLCPRCAGFFSCMTTHRPRGG